MLYAIAVFALSIGLFHPTAVVAQSSDKDLRRQIIAESIRKYPGSCPCPYSRARNGSRCGKRSAWSKPGGRAPLCYDTDISDEMLAHYKKRLTAN